MTLLNTKKTLALISTITLTITLSAGLPQTASADQRNGTASSLQISSKSISGGGQRRVLANGCAYSRAQAPGYAPTWHLILNPQALGLPVSRNCKPMLQD